MVATMNGGLSVRSVLQAPKRKGLLLVPVVIIGLALSFGAVSQARAQSALIVAIGADNVAGFGKGKNRGGVRTDQAFPAQLQGLLLAQGLDVHVTNAGVPGDTTADILARLDSAVPDGTRLVILDKANGNDKKAGLHDEQHALMHDIKSRLAARHIALFILPPWEDIPGAVANRDPDGHHFTAEGHAQIAAFLLPEVTSILAKPQP
jgi:acyl-CoA thioesterase-1